MTHYFKYIQGWSCWSEKEEFLYCGIDSIHWNKINNLLGEWSKSEFEALGFILFNWYLRICCEIEMRIQPIELEIHFLTPLKNNLHVWNDRFRTTFGIKCY